ncbi:MAG: LacI family DNA-binding transcriptional regulator [Gammaproteobacteria bacterium]|nr:LacI family DNA-binding transcriptional regulator [Gammaproteobacteria bacterium]MDH3805609.1 LacI family DNA-binding transcriptional regulator [Gammaproteobacteria bacterium]
MPRANIFDVAKLAGVSIKTVSRVVNHEPNVRASTKERVDQAIAELSYRPDQSARNLASHRSHLIGLVYDDPAAYELPTSGYIIKMQQGALTACRSAFSELLIHPCNYRTKDVAAQLTSLIEETRPAGIILAAPLSNMPKIVRAIDATGTPFVRLSPGKPDEKRFSIGTNDRESSAEMTRYLASLGHKRIAFITGHASHKAVANRFLGYQDGLQQSGLKFSERLVVAGDNSIESGEACAEKLLTRKQPPTAIFAANDDMAAGVIRVAHRMGVDVPEQLSVAGFDDIALARMIHPALTTVRQPLTEMAQRAAEALIEGKCGDASERAPETVPATLQIRESTGPAAR